MTNVNITVEDAQVALACVKHCFHDKLTAFYPREGDALKKAWGEVKS